MIGMWLGKLNWQDKKTKINLFFVGFICFMLFQGLRFFAKKQFFNEYWTNYIMSEYFPAYLPFMVITMGFAFMVISLLMFVGERFANTKIIQYLAKTGQMTLTHYVFHITIGMLVLAQITGKTYTGLLEDELPTPPIYILCFAISCFICTFGILIFFGGEFEIIKVAISSNADFSLAFSIGFSSLSALMVISCEFFLVNH